MQLGIPANYLIEISIRQQLQAAKKMMNEGI
jgi:hypothetical protein